MTNAVDEAITSRRSVRAFLPKPVSKELVEHILQMASRAPSGTNTQPWNVRVLTGEAKDKLCRAAVHAHAYEADKHEYSYKYYPSELPEPYISRRRKVGWDLYGLLGIKKGDREKTKQHHSRNYLFFDAPVGLIFTIDKMLELAQVTKDDLLYDIGCGDGRIVVTAAKEYGCKAEGYDLRRGRVKASLENVEKNNVGHLVRIEQKDTKETSPVDHKFCPHN